MPHKWCPYLNSSHYMHQLSPILIKVDLVMQNTSTVAIQLVHGCIWAGILVHCSMQVIKCSRQGRDFESSYVYNLGALSALLGS